MRYLNGLLRRLRSFLALVCFVSSIVVLVQLDWPSLLPGKFHVHYGGTGRRPAPKGVLLLTQMRSGSSFAGALLTTAAATFYTEEPVREYLLLPPSSPEDVSTALTLLRDILRCRFVSRPDYFQKRLMGLHDHNIPTINLCAFSVDLCLSPHTSEALCLASHVRLARVVALDLGLAAPLVHDTDIDTHVIHLVRDPRGVISSREKLSVKGYFVGDALNASSVCNRYRRDMIGAAYVKASFPHR